MIELVIGIIVVAFIAKAASLNGYWARVIYRMWVTFSLTWIVLCALTFLGSHHMTPETMLVFMAVPTLGTLMLGRVIMWVFT